MPIRSLFVESTIQKKLLFVFFQKDAAAISDIYWFTDHTLVSAANPHGADIEDNDFAEFEDFDDEGK